MKHSSSSIWSIGHLIIEGFQPFLHKFGKVTMGPNTSLEDNYTIQDDVKSVREGPIAFRGLVLHVIHKQGAWQIFQLKQLASSIKAML